MTYPTHQQYADLAKDAYENHIPSDDKITIGGNDYKVLAVANDRRSGYQGTVYLDLKTNAVIVAHRGTESPKKDWRDAVTDGLMVLNRDNGQAKAAVELTRKAMEELAKFNEKFPDAKPKPTISHTGHSLGGTLAQICAHYYDQQGVTFNAYGAASLGRIPEGGSKVVNYVKASDPVAAASPHYGKTVVLAAPDDIRYLSSLGYTDSTLVNTAVRLNPSAAVSRPLAAAAASVGSAHGIGNFTGSGSILSNPQALKLTRDNHAMIEAYRSDVNTIRKGLGLPNLDLEDIYNHFHPRPAGEPAKKNLQPLTQAQPLESIMQQYAQERPSFQLEDLPLHAQNIYRQGREVFTGFCRQEGIAYREEDLDNICMTMAAAGYREKMRGVSMMAINGDKVSFAHESPDLREATVQMAQAAATPVEESVRRIQETERQFEYDSLQRQMAQSQSRGMSIG